MDRTNVDTTTLQRTAISAMLSFTLGASLVLWSNPVRAEYAALQTAAALSFRPSSCAVQSQDSFNVWRRAERSSNGGLAAVCSHLAQVSTLLAIEPAAALLRWKEGPPIPPAGDAASAELHVAWRRLEARVALAEGDAARAFAAFEAIVSRSALSRWDPESLRDYAVSAVDTGHFTEAATLYRRLVALSAWLDERRQIALRIEAAVALARLPQVDVVEVLGYLEGLPSQESEPAVDYVAQSLGQIVQAMAGNGVTTTKSLEPRCSEVALQQLARLSTYDWQLLQSWSMWAQAHDASVWQWTLLPDVPPSYRALGQKLLGKS